MDKRKKVVQELKGLPKCDVTGFPQHLGEGRYWTQVVIRLHVLRGNYCHHCHRLMDHRLSVREEKVFFGNGLNHTLRLFLYFTDWHDGGNGASLPQPGQPND